MRPIRSSCGQSMVCTYQILWDVLLLCICWRSVCLYEKFTKEVHCTYMRNLLRKFSVPIWETYWGTFTNRMWTNMGSARLLVYQLLEASQVAMSLLIWRTGKQERWTRIWSVVRRTACVSLICQRIHERMISGWALATSTSVCVNLRMSRR